MFASAKTALRMLGVGAMVVAGAALSSAHASPITYAFSGTVSSVPGALSGTFSAGDALSGYFTFESTTAARAGSDSNFAVFDALTKVSFSIGGYGASSLSPSEIQVDNAPGAPNDRYGLVSRASDGLTGADVGGYALNVFGFRLDDSTNVVFSDALVLPLSLDLSDFDTNSFFVFFTKTDPVDFEVLSGTLTALTRVPEPGTLLVFGFGLAGLALLRRKKRQA